MTFSVKFDLLLLQLQKQMLILITFLCRLTHHEQKSRFQAHFGVDQSPKLMSNKEKHSKEKERNPTRSEREIFTFAPALYVIGFCLRHSPLRPKATALPAVTGSDA